MQDGLTMNVVLILKRVRFYEKMHFKEIKQILQKIILTKYIKTSEINLFSYSLIIVLGLCLTIVGEQSKQFF